MSRVLLAALLAAAIGVSTYSAPATASHAMGLWSPHPQYDTCSAAYHDSFAAVGTDGKRYPAWHPPEGTENGAPCTFGHEHGRDPRGSALLAAIDEQYGGVLFGYVNEQLDLHNTHRRIRDGMRHEDHVGHKIEWENDLAVFESTSTGRRPLQITCDFFMKVHQGTHSPDAFANNLHELLYAAQCRDRAGTRVGTKVIAYTMVAFGDPGGFSEGTVAGGFDFVKVRAADPARSQPGQGLRSLPTLAKIRRSTLVPPGQQSQYSLGLYEDWLSANYLRRSANSEPIAYFDPHFATFLPSRFYWPPGLGDALGIARGPDEVARGLGRSIDICTMKDGDGQLQARGGECEPARAATPPIGFDDPRSPFNGVHREFYFNQTTIANHGGPVIWYTDPFGDRASKKPFPGAIKQYVAAIDNRWRDDAGFVSLGGRTYAFESLAIGKDRFYGGRGVHAPN